MSAGRVYAIGCVENSLIKLGWATNSTRRLSECQVGSPVDLRLVWSECGGFLAETHLHHTFADRRRRGEWFDFADCDDPAKVIDAAYEVWAQVRWQQQADEIKRLRRQWLLNNLHSHHMMQGPGEEEVRRDKGWDRDWVLRGGPRRSFDERVEAIGPPLLTWERREAELQALNEWATAQGEPV